MNFKFKQKKNQGQKVLLSSPYGYKANDLTVPLADIKQKDIHKSMAEISGPFHF